MSPPAEGVLVGPQHVHAQSMARCPATPDPDIHIHDERIALRIGDGIKGKGARYPQEVYDSTCHRFEFRIPRHSDTEGRRKRCRRVNAVPVGEHLNDLTSARHPRRIKWFSWQEWLDLQGFGGRRQRGACSRCVRHNTNAHTAPSHEGLHEEWPRLLVRNVVGSGPLRRNAHAVVAQKHCQRCLVDHCVGSESCCPSVRKEPLFKATSTQPGLNRLGSLPIDEIR